jgi:hypothetical protein
MRRRLLIRRQRGPPNEGLIFPTPSFRDVLWPSERWPALASIWRGAGARTRRAGHRPREVSSRATRTERVRVVCSVGGRTARRVARHVARADRGGRHWSHSRGEHLRATHRAAPTGAEVESSAVRSPSARRKRDVRRTCRASRVQVRDRHWSWAVDAPVSGRASPSEARFSDHRRLQEWPIGSPRLGRTSASPASEAERA